MTFVDTTRAQLSTWDRPARERHLLRLAMSVDSRVANAFWQSVSCLTAVGRKSSNVNAAKPARTAPAGHAEERAAPTTSAAESAAPATEATFGAALGRDISGALLRVAGAFIALGVMRNAAEGAQRSSARRTVIK